MNKLKVRKDYGGMMSFSMASEDVEALTGSEDCEGIPYEAKFVRGKKGM